MEEELMGAIFGGDPLSPLRDNNRMFTPLEEFNKYDVSLSRYIDQYDNRAANQTNTEAFGNAAVQAVAEVVGGTIEGIGYLGDLPQHLNLLKGTEQEFGNWFSDIGKGIKEASRESNPIYGGDGFDPLSPRWWAKNMPSIASSLSLLIPAAGTVKGLSLLGKTTKLSKLTKGINIAKGTTLNSALKGTTGAVLSRYMEATMEASGQFDKAFKRNIQKGLSEEDAKLAAGKEASKVWYANQALLLTDLPQYFMHFNPISNKFAQFGWQAFTEGVEEGLQYGINKEAKDSKNVLSVYGNIIQNFPEYFDDPEFLTSVTMGAIGGAVFSIPSLLKRQKDKDKFRENIQKFQEIKKAEAEGNLTKVQAIKDKDLSTMSVDKLSSMKELSQDEEQIKVIDEIINIKTQAKATSSIDDKANKLAELKLNKDNLKKSKERLSKDSYFNEVYDNHINNAENTVTKEEFIDGTINQDFSSGKSKEFKKYVLDILKKDKIENNGNLNRTVESIKEVQDNINENIDEITKIVNDPDEFLDKKQEEKLQEMLNKPVKELFDYAIEDEVAEFAAVQKAQEILDQAEDVKENYEDVKEFIEDQEGGEILASQLAAIKEDKAVEVPRQENPDPQLDTINKIQSQLTTPANKKQARSMSKGYGEKTINVLGKANPLKGLTQDFRVRFNKEFKNNKEVQDQFRKELSEAKTAEQLIAVNNKYSGVEFQTKFKLTPEEHTFLEPLLKSFDITKQEYRNVIYNIYKYLDKPLTFESYIYTNDDGSTGMGYAYVLDGKYPIAIAPSINTLIKNLKDKNILSNEVLDKDGYLVSGTFKYYNVEQDFYDLQNLYKYGGEVNFLRDTSGEIVYQKGQYNNQEEFRTLSDITEDALITTVGANGELLFNKEKPSDFDLNVRSDQNKVKGWFYLVQKDTAGKYRLNRVYTKRLVDHQESFEELKRILQIAQDASKFFKGKVNKTLRGVELSEKMLEVLDNYEDKNDLLFKNAQTWFRDYSDLSKKVINEIAQTKEKNVYLDKALIFYFTDKDGIFNPITFLKSKGVFRTSAKTLEELTPETIEESIPVQIKVNNLKNTPFREIADKLITNAKDINQPFASPTFFFDIIPNNERQETNQKEQTQEQKREEIQQERSQETTEVEPVVLSNKKFRIIKIDNELVYQYKRGQKWIEYKNTNTAINRAKEQFGIDYEMVLAPQAKNIPFSNDNFRVVVEGDQLVIEEFDGKIWNNVPYPKGVNKALSVFSGFEKFRNEFFKDEVKPQEDLPDGDILEDFDEIENPDIGDELFKTTNEGKPINIKLAKKRLRRLLGKGVPVSIIDTIIEIGDIRAYGVASRSGIKLSELASMGTEYHEAFHIVFRNLNSKEDRQLLLDSVDVTLADIQRAKLLADKYNADPVEIAKEEKLADMFMEYMMGFDQLNIFQRIFKKISEFIAFVKGNLTLTQELFRDIRVGNYKDKIRFFPEERFKETTYTPSEEKQVINIALSRLDVLLSQRVKSGEIESMEEGYNTLFNETGGYLLDNKGSVFSEFYVRWKNSTGETRKAYETLILNLRNDLVLHKGKFKKVKGRSPKGNLYGKLLNRLHTRGLRFNGNEEVDLQDDIWKKYSNISVSVKENLSSRLKVLFNNLRMDVFDTLGLGYQLNYSGNEVFSIILSEIGGSINVDDMMEKIENSSINIVSRELLARIANKPILQKDLFLVAQKVHPTFYTVVETEKDKFSVIQSNRDSKRKLIRAEIYQAVGDQKEKLPLERVLPASVISNIGDKLNELQATFDKVLDQQGYEFTEFIKAVEKYYPNSYQDAHLNVEGERVYEWQNSNFIARQINKYNKGLVQDFYNKDVLYQDMPLFKDNKTLEFTYLDGIKPFGKSKGVKYRNYSDKDMLITLLEYFNISTKEMIVSLPILETAPTLAGIKVKKYSKNKAVEHIVNLAYNEYSRATSNPLNVKNYNKFQKEYLIFGDVIEVDNNGLFNPSKTKENILNKIERNTISFTRKLNSLGLNYDESIIKDFLANHILNHSQVMLFSVGDPAFYKSDVDYYKRAKEIHSPGTFLDTSELPDTFRVKVAEDIEERSPQADEIEKVIGEGSDYNKSSLTDAQTYIDPISYRHRMIGLRRWTDKDQEAFEKIMVGEYSDINWQVLKPFYYDLHLMDIKDENDEILETKVVPVQKKDSEFTLYPVYGVKTINGKENPLYSDKYKEILEGMGYEFTDSSVKHNPKKREYDVFTFDTTIKVGKNLGNDIMTFNYDSWRLQQETPSHYLDDSGNLGTQIMKLITADIPQELHDLRDEYDQILNEDIKIAFEKVKENFNDEEKLKKTLQLEVLERGLGEEFIKSLEQLPYWHPIQTQRIQSIMNSMFRKNVSRRKFANGYSFINSSSYGKDLKIVWNDPNDPTKGVKHLEAYTPVFNSAFEKFRDEDGLIDMEKIKGTPEEKMLEGVVYRIPTEDKFSMIPIKVVGFLPSNSGNIMLPHEVTTMAGLDFDIDKVFGFYYGLTPPLSEWVKNKKVPKEIYDKYSEAKQEVIDYFNNEKYAEAFELRELKYQVTQDNDPLLKSRLRLLEKKVDPKLIQDLEERKDTLNELKEDLQREKEEYYREEYEKVIGQVVRDNRKLDIIKQILSHESTTKALLTPQGFQDIVKVNEQLGLVDKEKLDYTDPLTLVKIANRMNAGQSILGVYANANAVNAVLQYSEKPLIMKRAAVFDGDAYTQLGRKDLVERITKALGMRIGMSADNGKDPQAEYYNSNIYTAPVESMLLMLGIPSQTTQMFLAQPILKEFTKMYFNNGGTKQAENDLMTKLNLRVDANQPVSNISSDVLKSEILEFNKLTTEKQKADFLNRSVQKELLKNFMIYKLRSDKFNDFVTAVKLGDVGAGTNQVGNLFKMNKFLGQFKFIENAREFIKSDNFMMTMFREGIIKADEEINKYLIPLEAGFRNMIYSLEENKGYAMTEKEIQDVLNNVYTFVFQKVFNVRKKDIDAAINLLPKLKKKYPDNALLKRMNVIDGYIEFIGAIGNDYSEIDEIKRAWNELEQKEIETLIKYSFGQSGVTQTFKGFGHMQPVDFHIELLRKYPEIESELRNTLSNLDPQFMELYIRNNYKSSTTVPNISNIVYGTETDLQLDKPHGTYIKYKGKLYKQSYQRKDVYSKIPGLGVYKNRRNVIFEYNVTSSEYNKSNKSNGNKMYNLRKNPEDYLTSGEIQKICD